MATKADRMYAGSPRMERDDKGHVAVRRDERKPGEIGPDTRPEVRHAHDRREMVHRHVHERLALHHRHEIEHSAHRGNKTALHDRHEREVKEMHDRHEAEHKALHDRHEKELAAPTRGVEDAAATQSIPAGGAADMADQESV